MSTESTSPSIAIKVAHNTFLNVVNTILGLANAVLISVIIARSLGPNLLGQYSYVNYLVSLVVLIFSLGISGTITKILSEYGSKYDEEMLRDYVRFLVRMLLLPVVASALVLWLLLVLINPHTIQEHWLIFPIAAASVIPLYLSAVFRSIVSGFQDFRLLLRINVYGTALLLLGTIIAALAGAKVAGYLIVAIVPNIFIVLYILRTYPWIAQRSNARSMQLKERLFDTFSYLWVVAIITVLDMVVWQYSEVFFLGMFRSSNDVAYYSVAFTIASVALITLPGAFTGVLMPAISGLFGDAATERIRIAFHVSLRYMILFVVPLCFLLGALAQPIISVLYGSKYMASSEILPPLFAAAALGSISSVGSTVLYSIRKQKSLLILMAIVTAVNITLDLLLIPKYGLRGAVIANVSAQSFAALGTLTIAFVLFRKKMDLRLFGGPLLTGIILAAVAYGMSRTISGVFGLALALLCSMVLGIILVRVLRLIDPLDRGVFTSLGEKFPTGIRRLYHLLLRFMIIGP